MGGVVLSRVHISVCESTTLFSLSARYLEVRALVSLKLAAYE